MKLGVCVPYRNREEHLKEFIPAVSKYLEDRGINFCMYFCNQADDKLFNRGATKNIAAKFAFEDGCDYIVWHDIDMIPEEGGGADYSYPLEHPVHIATNISQMNYELKYFEYFGGAVLFTKDQVEKTNGYSNGYWDWGMEDDDLFWRCHLEGMLDEKVIKSFDGKYLHFTGQDSYCKVPGGKAGLRDWNYNSHTVSILCRAEQQPEKVLPYLIGDKGRRYVEFPILTVPGHDYRIGFNNSKAMTLQFFDTFSNGYYMWAKRYDSQWTNVTATFDVGKKEVTLYINGKCINAKLGEGSESPIHYSGRLMRYGDQDLYIGTTPTVARDNPGRFFKGDIASLQIFDRALSEEEVKRLALGCSGNLESDTIFDLMKSDHLQKIGTVEEKLGMFGIVDSVLPFRRTGRFRCLPHEDEGIVRGRFMKGETTARNERRYQLEMQQGKIDYKNDGIAQVQFKLLGIDQLGPKAKMINVEL